MNYFVIEDNIYLYNDVKMLCLKYLDRQIYNLDHSHIKLYNNMLDVDWIHICINNKLSEDFINAFFDKLDKRLLLCYQRLSIQFMEKYMDKFSDKYKKFMLIYQKLNISFIEKHKKIIDWKYLSRSTYLNMEILEKYENKLDWEIISFYAKLNENIIDTYCDKIYWQLLQNNIWTPKIIKQKYKDRS